METTSSSVKENFTDAQKIIHSWLNDKITDQQLISYAQQNCNQLNCNNNNSNHSFFLLLFNTLYLMDQEIIKLNQKSNICSAFNNQDKSDLIKTIYDIEQDTLKSSYLIHDFIKASKITTKDISKIKKLIELVCEIDKNNKYFIEYGILFPLFDNSSEEKCLFNNDNIVDMVKLFPFFSSTPFGDKLIKSDAFKIYLQQMINDNKIEEIASIINDYTIIIDFEYLKSTLTNIFDLNLQNNKILKDFIKQKSYKLIAELLCSDHYYSYETTNPLSRIVNENNIININTAQVKRELDEKYNEGFDMLLGSEDIPYQFDIKSFIELCFKALFRITNSIDIDECKIIHNQLFTQKSKQIDSNITPQEVVNGANNNPIVQQQQRSLGR